MRTTLKFLAEEANLSTTAVSLILNGKNVRVSKEKKQKVLDLAEKYNYTPNSLAVGLVTKKTNTVGLIVPDIANAFFAEIAKNLERSLSYNGYSLILCNTNDNLSEEIKYAQLLLAKDVDALIVCPTIQSVENSKYIKSFIESGKKVVAFDRYSDDMPCSTVAGDNFLGSRQAVEYLIKKGHRRIGCIGGPADSYSAKLRIKGYMDALNDNGIKIDEKIIRQGDYKFDSGYEQGLELLKTDITAAFVCNDLMAYGFYRAVTEKNKIVPDDISVIGYDDLFFSSMLDVPLTTVKQNTESFSNEICRLMNKNDDIEHVLIKTRIIERESVKDLNL